MAIANEEGPSAAANSANQFQRRRLLARGGLIATGTLVGTMVGGTGGPASASQLSSSQSPGMPLSDTAAAGGLFDVMNYGATGNGTTDDTAALQQALNDSAVSPGGGICLVPHGTFLVSKAIMIPAGAHLIIDGTILLADGANQDMLFVNGSNVLIEGTGRLEGNGSKQSATIGGIVNTAGIANLTVRGLTVNNVRNWGVNVTNCSNVLLEGMVMSNNGNSNEFAAEAINCWARNCTITGTNDFGFAFYGGVQNSGITDSLSYGNAGPGIGILSDSAQPALCQNITIANNHSFDNIAGQPGIAVITGPPITGHHTGVTISGNETHGNQGAGILVADVEDCLISGNICHEDQQQELYLSAYLLEGNQHTLSGVQVIGNHFANPGTAAQPTAALQVLNPPSNSGPTGPGAGSYLTDVSIVHNTVLASKGTMTYCLAGGPADRVFIHGNVLRGWSKAPADFTRGLDDIISDNTAPIG